MIRQGDMVRVGSVSPMHGVVLKTSREGLRRGRLSIKTVCRNDVREVRTSDVTAQWRRVKGK